MLARGSAFIYKFVNVTECTNMETICHRLINSQWLIDIIVVN